MNRPLDISFALTDLLQRNATAGNVLSRLIDPDRIAASGWSLGGYAAMTLAGGDDLVCDRAAGAPESTCVPSPVDPRIRVIVPLDGSTQCLWFYEMARITVPTMGIGREWSVVKDWQARLHAATQGHPAYRVDMQGIVHSSFSNNCEAAPILYGHGLLSEAGYQTWKKNFCSAPLPTTEAHRLTTKYMVAFLKENLSGQSGYQPILTPGYALGFESMIEFFLTEKRNPAAIDGEPGLYIYFTHQPGSVQTKAEKDPKELPAVAYFGFEENR